MNRKPYLTAMSMLLVLAASVIGTSKAIGLETITQSFESETPGGATPPAGWALLTVSGGSGTYSNTASAGGSNGAGGFDGVGCVLAGSSSSPYLPDSYLVYSNFSGFDMKYNLNGSYEYRKTGTDGYGSAGFILGDIKEGSLPQTDPGQLVLISCSRNNFGNSPSKIMSGTGATLATDPAGKKVVYDIWYRTTFTWTPTNATIGIFSYTIQNYGAGWQDLLTVVSSNVSFTSTAGFFGVCDIRDISTTFDNISITGRPIMPRGTVLIVK